MNLDRATFERDGASNSRAIYVGENICLCWVANRFKMYVVANDISLSPHLMLNGYWESWISICFMRLLSILKPQSVINVGANVGYYSLLASAVLPGSEVVAYEPQSVLAKLLGKSAAINGFDRLNVRQVAAGSNDGSVWIRTVGDYYGSAMVSDSRVDGVGFEIDCVRLDSESLDPIEMMLVDAEGYEFDVLLGAENRLRAAKKCVVFLEFSGGRYSRRAEFVEWIRGNKFEVFRIDYSGKLKLLNLDFLNECEGVLDVVIAKGVSLG